MLYPRFCGPEMQQRRRSQNTNTVRCRGSGKSKMAPLTGSGYLNLSFVATLQQINKMSTTELGKKEIITAIYILKAVG